MNRIVIRLKAIKYKKFFFLLFIFLSYLLNYTIRIYHQKIPSDLPFIFFYPQILLDR